ncbi:MAG: efflux RND transporter periplasmic adaptor subunit [Thermodesulfobacteriota bacterium]
MSKSRIHVIIYFREKMVLKSFKRYFFFFLCILGISSIYSCESHQAEIPKERVIQVEATQVKQGDILREIKFTGTIEAQVEVQVFPKITARIEALKVDKGDRVKKDDLLALLESEELRAQVAQAEAALQNIRAKWAQIEVGARPEEISQAEDLVAKARAKLREAENNYERMKGLFSRGVITKRDFESAELAYQVAQADLNSAQKQLKILLEGATREERQALLAQLRQAEAALEGATIRLSYTRITSPIQGIVSQRFFDEGNLAVPTQPLFTIVQMDIVKVVIFFPEHQVRFIVPGVEAILRVNAYPDHVFRGVVVKVSPTLDPATRLFSAEIRIENQKYLLRPGMFSNVTLAVEPRKNVLLVPKEAVLYEEEYSEGSGYREIRQNHYLYVVKEGRAYKRKVLIGHETSSAIEIREGLELGDLVVTRGVHLLRDGDRVMITPSGEGRK